jgi:hypothetical protein
MKNLYRTPGMKLGEVYGPLDALRHVAEAGEFAATGEPIPPMLKLTLLALVRYWPTIRPTLETLARDTGLQRKTVIAHLATLTDLGVLRSPREGRTAFRQLDLDQLVRVDPQPRMR